MEAAKNQKPLVNAWYTNLTGQLFKVRFILYSDARISHIMIEYVNGTCQTINMHEWECLKLVRHSYAHRSGQSNQEYSF